MSMTRKSLWAIVMIVVFLVVPLNWYIARYSMERAESFEVLVANPQHQLLIATQGSEYKDAVVAGLLAQMKGMPVSIKVIDISGLPAVDTNDWDALVILHTWEQWRAPEVVEQFIDRSDLAVIDKVIVHTTSGNGESAMDGIDAITSASLITDVSANVSLIVQRINQLFK